MSGILQFSMTVHPSAGGGGGATRTLIQSDDFNRASLGSNWAQLQLSFGSMATFSSTHVCGTSAQADANRQVARWVGTGTFTNDQYSSIVVSNITTTLNDNYGIGVICRASADTDANRDYYEFVMLNTESPGSGQQTFELNKWVNGTQTTLNTGLVTIANGNRIELEVQGTTIRACINGTALGGSWTQTDSSIASGQPGICGAGGDNIRGDDWQGGSLT
jgi:hypothetical protein